MLVSILSSIKALTVNEREIMLVYMLRQAVAAVQVPSEIYEKYVTLEREKRDGIVV